VTGDAILVTGRLEGPAPASQIARDLATRGAWIAPLVLAFGCFWGINGVLSAGYALLIVVVNFLLAGWMLTVAGRISFVAMAGAAMFGYLIRLGIITLAVFPVIGLPWVEKVPLGITLIVTHLGLLVWELRHLSLSYAYPGLKPSQQRGDGAPVAPPSANRPSAA
jgi:hypothetical protein